jgi:hypothetical protein
VIFFHETIIDSLVKLKSTDEIIYGDVLLRNKKINTDRIQNIPKN